MTREADAMDPEAAPGAADEGRETGPVPVPGGVEEGLEPGPGSTEDPAGEGGPLITGGESEEDAVSVLTGLGVDLSAVAADRVPIADGDLWETELTRVKEILKRRQGHAAVLIGPDGVGKQALAVVLARHIAEGRVPPRLLGRRVIELPFYRVLSSVRQPGDFEKIVFAALREAAAREDVILFLSQITSFMGIVGEQRAFFNAAHAIELGCRQPGLYLLGSGTPQLYREAIRTLPWCGRLLVRVEVPEPSRNATLGILHERAGDLAEFHGISIGEEAIEASVDLSGSHIRERVLPGKALELLDRAASKLATAANGSPDAPPLGAEHVAEALSDWIGIPTSKLTSAGGRELLSLEENLAKRVKGQDHCIRKLADTIRVTMLGLDARPTRPNGVFLFVGPPGVGKTELVHGLAHEVYGSDELLFEFNMARYSDEDGLARLIGLKLGDADFPGDLSSTVLRHPHSVVVFEHIERAHRDVAVMMMQIFREGYIVDGHGSKVFFSNATVVMTSNSENIVPDAGENGAVGFGQVDHGKRERHVQEAREAIEEFFPAEFMDGIDEVLLFDQLGDEALRQIVQIHLDDVRARLALREIALNVTEGAVTVLVEKGHSREYGARNLGRTVEGLVLKPLARFLIANPSASEVTVRTVEGDVEVIEGRGSSATFPAYTDDEPPGEKK